MADDKEQLSDEYHPRIPLPSLYFGLIDILLQRRFPLKVGANQMGKSNGENSTGNKDDHGKN